MPACPSKRRAGGAVRADRDLDQPVVMKTSSAQVAHKTALGGVRLDVHGDDEVHEAYDAVTAGALRRPAHGRRPGLRHAPRRQRADRRRRPRDPDRGWSLRSGLAASSSSCSRTSPSGCCRSTQPKPSRCWVSCGRKQCPAASARVNQWTWNSSATPSPGSPDSFLACPRT